MIEVKKGDIENGEENYRLIEKIGQSVNKYCDCGGRGPEDTKACPACLIWHDIKSILEIWI